MPRSFIIKIVDAHRQGILLFRIFEKISIVMAFAALFIASDDPYLAVTSVLFNILAAFLNWWPRYRRLPGSIIISFQMAFFFSLPIVWIGMTSRRYDFTIVFDTPSSNALYFQSLPLAIGFLAIALYALIIGMVLGNKYRNVTFDAFGARANRSMGSTALLLLLLVVVWLSFSDTLATLTSLSQRWDAERVGKEESLAAFLFNDAAFLFLFPVLFYSIFSSGSRLHTLAARINYLGVFLIFFGLFTMGSSKAGILLVFMPLFLYPIAINFSSGKRVYWPTTSAFLGALILAAPMFIFSMISRQIISTGNTLSTELMLKLISELNLTSINELFFAVVAPIFDRLSSSLNNYVVIFTHYYFDYDFIYALHFAEYLLQSFLNLILPGTPFLDAYLPSSSMLPKVVSKVELIGLGDSSTFWVSANTQSYTIFGVLLILVGPLIALPILMLAGFIFSYVYQKLDNPIYKTLAIFSFQLTLFSYGVEVAMQTTIQFFVGTVVMVAFLHVCHRSGSIVRPIFRKNKQLNSDG